jgi:hypothetical protein
MFHENLPDLIGSVVRSAPIPRRNGAAYIFISCPHLTLAGIHPPNFVEDRELFSYLRQCHYYSLAVWERRLSQLPVMVKVLSLFSVRSDEHPQPTRKQKKKWCKRRSYELRKDKGGNLLYLSAEVQNALAVYAATRATQLFFPPESEGDQSDRQGMVYGLCYRKATHQKMGEHLERLLAADGYHRPTEPSPNGRIPEVLFSDRGIPNAILKERLWEIRV